MNKPQVNWPFHWWRPCAINQPQNIDFYSQM